MTPPQARKPYPVRTIIKPKRPHPKRKQEQRDRRHSAETRLAGENLPDDIPILKRRLQESYANELVLIEKLRKARAQREDEKAKVVQLTRELEIATRRLNEGERRTPTPATEGCPPL